MGHAVELDFDQESTDRIVALSDAIYRACGGLHLTGINALPHISLAVFDTVAPTGIEPLLATLAMATAPFSVQLSAVGSFPGPQGVVYLAPVVTPDLLTLHARFHAQLTAAGLASHGYYRPGQWVPHCTVGMELSDERLADAVRLCRRADVFQAVTITGVRLIEFRPVRALSDYSF